MTYFFKLLYSISGLDVWVVSCTDSSHWGGLISCVRLGWVLKVTVWTPGAVDADVAGCGDVWAAVGFAHYGYDSYAWGCSHRFCLQQWCQLALIVLRQCTNNLYQFRRPGRPILLRNLTYQARQMNFIPPIIRLYQRSNNFRNIFKM